MAAPVQEEIHGLAEMERHARLEEHAYRRRRIRILDIFGGSGSRNISRKIRSGRINLKVRAFTKPHAKRFYFSEPLPTWVWKEGISVLLNAESCPVDDESDGKLSRETSSYPGRHGACGAMCQDRTGWADWEIRRMGEIR